MKKLSLGKLIRSELFKVSIIDERYVAADFVIGSWLADGKIKQSGSGIDGFAVDHSGIVDHHDLTASLIERHGV
jgi:hypothetical protein